MESKVKDHYNSDNLTQNIKTALLAAGINLSNLELKNLSSIDQLHTGGAKASIELFNKAKLSTNAQVLDAGCGIGGSSRLLARQFNCNVIGIDLADKFIEAADFLTHHTKLEDNISFQQGSILDLPYEDNTFDVILCQHILMNIQDKSKAIKEFSRVLKPNGKLILHEITRGESNTIVFPVPWADKPSISILEPWDALSTIFTEQGFETLFYMDGTDTACSWWEKIKTISQTKSLKPNFLGPRLIFGKNAKYFGKNMHANFKNHAICLVEAILKKS